MVISNALKTKAVTKTYAVAAEKMVRSVARMKLATNTVDVNVAKGRVVARMVSVQKRIMTGVANAKAVKKHAMLSIVA